MACFHGVKENAVQWFLFSLTPARHAKKGLSPGGKDMKKTDEA
jgi:hypothetical protein